MSKLRLSVSRLGRYGNCPRKYFYQFESPLPQLTDYPLLAGVVIHRHIWWMHKEPAKPRPFYYETKTKAIGAWFHRWREELDEATREGLLRERTPFRDKRYARIGLICVARYWDGAVRLPPPLQRESRYSTAILPGVTLTGTFDQLRQVSLPYIAKHRPDLIVAGRLRDGYDPVVIVDFKTGADDYDIWSRRHFRRDPTLMEEVRAQFDLPENLQAPTYTFLYERTTGRKPVGFVWWHLRSGRTFFTYRGEEDYQTLDGVIHHFLENVQAESFPKNVDRHCQWCV